LIDGSIRRKIPGTRYQVLVVGVDHFESSAKDIFLVFEVWKDINLVRIFYQKLQAGLVFHTYK